LPPQRFSGFVVSLRHGIIPIHLVEQCEHFMTMQLVA